MSQVCAVWAGRRGVRRAAAPAGGAPKRGRHSASSWFEELFGFNEEACIVPDDADFLKQLLSDHEVASHFKKGELEAICSTDFHYKHIEARFKKLGL